MANSERFARCCAQEAWDVPPQPRSIQCALGLAPVCDRLVQDAGTHFFDSLGGWRGAVRNKRANCGQNQDSIQIHQLAMCTRWPILRGRRGVVRRRHGICPQNQDSENVYLDSHLSVADWCRMEVHIFLRAREGGEGMCETSMHLVPKAKIQ